MEEEPDHHCINYKGEFSTWGNLVSDQESCQKQCEADSKCVGISYSSVSALTSWCYICTHDILVRDYQIFGFFRKPGPV